MNEDEIALIAEQLRRAMDLVRADIDALRATQNHDREMNARRIAVLEAQAGDHEMRLRSATEGVTQFKIWAGFASGGSGIVSLVAFLKAFLGG